MAIKVNMAAAMAMKRKRSVGNPAAQLIARTNLRGKAQRGIAAYKAQRMAGRKRSM